MKYVGDITEAADEVKRLYINDLKIVRPCPECGLEVECHQTQNYISYGDANLSFWCGDGCEHEWEVEATFTAQVIIETKD
jgi:hypothetical protein